MQLTTLDWGFIFAFFALSLGIGIYASKRSSQNASEFFLSGRNMPWWLLGISMVATTFSADTPNLVTDIVRKDGVAGNWAWWAFLLTGMLTVFVYARLWRRSGVLTDLEFYELRYSGAAAAFLRGFRAVYLGVFFNILVMATVCLAAIKIGSVLLGLSPVQTLLLSSIVTVAYSTLGGLRGIILTDFFQFTLAMIGTIWAAMYIVDMPEIGGLSNLLNHENVKPHLNLIPDMNTQRDLFFSLLIIPLAVQWWASYYPGAEPGGGGYIAQRMLAAKDEKNAIWATLLFNVAHYALRPWPWMLIALASMVVFPDLESIRRAFPNVDPSVVNDDLAYPAMISFLPKGLLGLVIASLIAAFMSTISTHLNWGASYLTNDVYKRFLAPQASEKELVNIGRIATVLLMFASATVALYMDNAKEVFDLIVLVGAGTGLIFILRWFWWRINAYSEIAAMVISVLVALYFKYMHVEKLGFEPLENHIQLLSGVGITTIGWLLVTFLTRPTDEKTLLSFYKKIKPAKDGWLPIVQNAMANGELQPTEIESGKLPIQILCMLIGSVMVYAALFSVGFWLYGEWGDALLATGISTACFVAIIWLWKKL
ncbi:MAG TPA: Na+:solute symporter [Phaeodactylibacter sp.]|nr:Na+:solute symporter [Phaeodactylibacter sp.]